MSDSTRAAGPNPSKLGLLSRTIMATTVAAFVFDSRMIARIEHRHSKRALGFGCGKADFAANTTLRHPDDRR
jgi:hypothetical protein